MSEERTLYEVPVDASFVKYMVFNFHVVLKTDKDGNPSVESADLPKKWPRWATGSIPNRIELRDDVALWMAEHCKNQVCVVEQRNDGGITIGFESLAEATHFKLRFVGTEEPG